MTLPIQSKAAAIDANTNYFRHLKQNEPGIQKLIVGAVVPEHWARSSRFVVRRRTRSLRTCMQKQGPDQLRKFRRYYSIAYVDYCLAHISWDTGKVTEGQAFTTQADAARAMQ